MSQRMHSAWPPRVASTSTRTIVALAATAAALVGALVSAQDAPPAGGGNARGGGPAGWATVRGDAQRTAAVRGDQFISVDDLKRPGFGLEWTVTLGQPGETFGEGISSNTAQLNPAPGNLASSTNTIYGWELDTGSLVWTRHFDVPTGARTAACPGGLAGVTRNAPLTGGVAGGTLGPRGFNHLATLESIGGQPGAGVEAVVLVRAGGAGRAGAGGGAAGRGGAPAGGAPAAGAAPARGAAPPAGTPPPAVARGTVTAPPVAVPPSPAVYTVTSDGLARSIGQQLGKEVTRPIPFVPAGAHVSSVTAVNQVLFATTINRCGGAPNGVWALPLASGGRVMSFLSGANPVGAPAFSAGGTVYVAIGAGAAGTAGYANSIVALDRATLAVKDWFTATGAPLSTAPVVVAVGGREMVAAATADGRVYVLDAVSLGGSDHKTPVAVSVPTNTSRTWAPTAIAAWQDDQRSWWVALAGRAAAANVTALRVSAVGLSPGWTSKAALASPSAPIVVNDVVFVADRRPGTEPAVLRALDGATGAEIWTSGTAMKSPMSSTPIWSSSGQVYVLTSDRKLHAFGFAQDRH